MASGEMNLVTDQRLENGTLNSQIVFQEESLQFNCGVPQRRVGDPHPERKTREVSGFVSEKLFSLERDRYFRNPGVEFQRNAYDKLSDRQDRSENQNWNGEGSTGTPSCGGSEEEEEEDDDDDEDEEVDEGDGEVDGLVATDEGHNNKNSSGSVHSSSDKLRNENLNLQKHHSSFGSSRGLLMKDDNVVCSANNIRGGSTSEQQWQQGGISHYENGITIAEPETYYSQFLQGAEGQTIGHKETARESGCGFSKDESSLMDTGESLRTILSDPVTGTLMDDAMILPCGHSFGSGGMQHVFRMKACYTCSKTVSEESFSANLSLRLAVQAFRREEELQSCRVSRKRRERFEQDKSGHGDPYSTDLSRGKGVQFPFAVTDRVVIKGNKRTPLRFVGREAVVTTQCLNGWYVVKTLDNAESVKLQYRSLAKVSDSPSSTSNMTSSKIAPNWL